MKLKHLLGESMIGIKTDRSFKPADLQKALDKAKIKGYRMDRLSMTLTALKLDKKYFNDAQKIIDDLGLAVMMAKESKLNEGPYNDPALKALRIKKKGEPFPDLSRWWEYQPEDIMTVAYWSKGQLPPSDRNVWEQEWANIVKQLHVKYPIPADAQGHLDMDTIGESKTMKRIKLKDLISEADIFDGGDEGSEEDAGISTMVKGKLGPVKQRLIKVFGDIDDKTMDRLGKLPRTEQINLVITLLTLFGVKYQDFNMLKTKIAQGLKDEEAGNTGE